MRPFVVELSAECVEAILLSAEVRCGRSRRLGFEGAVHAFVAAVLGQVPSCV